MGWFSKKLTVAKMKEAVVKTFEKVKASYYVSTSDSESMDFSAAKAVGFNTALCADLDTLRKRITYELRQNGMAKGLGRTYANSAVNTGPMLSIESDDKEWARRVELSFAAWAKQAGYLAGESLGEMTHLGVRRFFPDGEYFKAARTDKNANNPVKLKFFMVAAPRIDDPFSTNGNKTIKKGIEVDADGRPVAYYVSKTDPDIATSLSGMQDFDRVEASKMIHVFYREDPSQIRGEPWLAQGLPAFHKVRRYDEATIAAAIVASKMAMMLVNKNPDIVASAAEILPSGVMDIQDGVATVLPPGYEMQGFNPTQPANHSEEFRRSQIATAGFANGVPANIATGDSSNSSFASARYDGVSFEIEGDVCRQIIESRDLTPSFFLWLRQAMAVQEVGKPVAPFFPVWRWRKESRHTDPLKAENAAKTRVQNSLGTVGELHMENGKDREQAYQELLSEVKRYKADGLVHPSQILTLGKAADNGNQEKE